MRVALHFMADTASRPMPTVVLFQKNAADRFGDSAIAWRTVAGLFPGERAEIDFAAQLAAGAHDSLGGYLPQQPVTPGQALSVTEAPAGELLASPIPATAAHEMQVRNGLPNRPIEAASTAGRTCSRARPGSSPARSLPSPSSRGCGSAPRRWSRAS